MDYYKVLKRIHAIVQPRTYVEIGVRHGESWQLVAPTTVSIGIDPAPEIRHEIPGTGQLFEGTSDAFFAQYDPRNLLGQLPVDLAFIDGMHLFENALTDFINIERNTHKGSHILIHDCLPIDAVTSARERTTAVWSGDVWKLIVCLARERPDLRISVLDTSPTGLAVVSYCDPDNTHLRSRLGAIKRKYMHLPYTVLGDDRQKRHVLHVCSAVPSTLQKLFTPRHVSAPGTGKTATSPAPTQLQTVHRSKAAAKKTAPPRMLGVLLCYNDADILADAIDHLIINHHDLVIWDHGSSDQTPEVISRYTKNIVEHRHIPRAQDFYGLYEAMSTNLMKNWVQHYDWISWPDQDEILEGPDRQTSYAEHVLRVYQAGYDWIEFDNYNYWWTAKDHAAIASPVRRVRHYALFPDCAPRIRSWRASCTNIRQFNHNPPAGRPYPARFRLRHYPMRDAAQMQRRLIADRAQIQRGAANYHYNNMRQRLDCLNIVPTALHYDNGHAELNPTPCFDWRQVYGHAPAPSRQAAGEAHTDCTGP